MSASPPSGAVDLITAPDTLRAYDDWSARYDLDPNPLVAATAWVLARAPLEVRGSRVVELGCGTGRHAAGLLAAGAAAYLGVDGSAGMLEVARAKAGDARCRWLEADLAALPALEGPAYDAALIALVLEHVADLGPPLAGLARWLAPGATLRIVELHPERIAAGTAAHFAAGGVERRFASVAHAAPDLLAALAAAGFVDVEARDWVADDALIDAAPRLAKHRGKPVVLDVRATRARAPRPSGRR